MIVMSCKSDPTAQSENPNNNNPQSITLYAKWLWRQTSGGISGGTTVANDSVRGIAEFTETGNYLQFRNDTLKATHTFVKSKQKTMYSQDSLEILFLDGLKYQYLVIIKLTKDSLTLGDDLIDGFVSEYTKTK